MGLLGISERIDEYRLQAISNDILKIDDGFITDWYCDSIGSPNRNFVTEGVYRIWLWLEEIAYEPRSWEWNDYAYAAEKLGEFQASYLLGNPLPSSVVASFYQNINFIVKF
ncbi:MAG: hypothetical protein K0Q73_549 [Paenibacillus sp.]|jgi:hypothetical protein|nr:hypothetical protein [Paenibacillus sp.]